MTVANERKLTIARAMAEAVAAAVAAKLSEPVEGEAAPTAGGDVVAAIEESRDEILAALAEMDLTGAAPAKPAEPAAEGAAPAAPALAVPGDLTDIRESLARIEAGVLRITAAPAADNPGTAAPVAPPAAADRTLDITRDLCPMTFVRTRLALDSSGRSSTVKSTCRCTRQTSAS